MVPTDVILSPEDRARLAHKGRLLYAKFCGTDGRGICAESFALFQLWQGNPEVARNLLDFFLRLIESLRVDDPHPRLSLAEELAARVARHLEAEGEGPPRVRSGR